MSGTERFDRGLKFARYRRIETLLRTSSRWEPRVETYTRRDAAEWSLREYAGLDLHGALRDDRRRQYRSANSARTSKSARTRPSDAPRHR